MLECILTACPNAKIRIHIHIYVCINTHAYENTCMHTYIRTSIQIFIHAYMHICMCTYTPTCKRACWCVRVSTHTCTSLDVHNDTSLSAKMYTKTPKVVREDASQRHLCTKRHLTVRKSILTTKTNSLYYTCVCVIKRVSAHTCTSLEVHKDTS